MRGVGSEENITTPTSGEEEDGTAIYGQIKGTSIVFIKDVGKIWTHGKVYDGSTINVDELQDKLVSGENIKTINGTSILGEGDITIESGHPDANIQAVDVGEEIEDVDVRYATKEELETLSERLGEKQDKLVSGTNIKTINGTSLLGSGNIVISGGGSGGGSGAYAEVNHGTSDTTFTLTPNTFHIWDEVENLTLTLGSETAGVANEFLFQFTSGATATTLTLPDDIKWANDSAPTIAENMIYQVSILKGLASVLEFDNKPKVATISFKIRNYECIAEEGMTWEQWVSSEYNTINCSFMGNNIQRTGEIVGTSDEIYVTKTDVIASDFTYILISMT